MKNIFTLLFLFILSSCSDPLGNTIKSIGGGYYLKKFDEALPATYYVTKSKNFTGGGVYDGVVEEIFISGSEIFARVSRLSSADPNGIYLLDTNTGKVTFVKSTLNTLKPVQAVFDAL